MLFFYYLFFIRKILYLFCICANDVFRTLTNMKYFSKIANELSCLLFYYLLKKAPSELLTGSWIRFCVPLSSASITSRGVFENLLNIPLSEKCPCTEFFWSVFSPNAGKNGPEKLQIWTLFRQCPWRRLCQTIDIWLWIKVSMVYFKDTNPCTQSGI